MTAEQGPGRRLTPEQERRGAELFAEGKSEREVAKALGVGAGTAHRLHERIQAADAAAREDAEGLELTPLRPYPLSMLPADAAVQEAEAIVAGQRPTVGPETAAEIQEAERDAVGAEIVDALTAKRAELAEALTGHQERAAASQAAIASLDAERLELLAAGRYAAPLRGRRADAESDLADSRAIIGMIEAQLAEIDAQLGAHQAAQREAEAQAARDEARIEGERLVVTARDKLRGAVVGDVAVGELLRVATSLARLEHASGCWWDAEVLPPALPGNPRDAWLRDVQAVWAAAKTGGQAAVQQALSRLDGRWVERDRAEFAAMHTEAAERLRQTQFRAAPADGDPVTPAWLPAAVGLDEYDRPILHDPVFVPQKPRPDLGYWGQ